MKLGDQVIVVQPKHTHLGLAGTLVSMTQHGRYFEYTVYFPEEVLKGKAKKNRINFWSDAGGGVMPVEEGKLFLAVRGL